MSYPLGRIFFAPFHSASFRSALLLGWLSLLLAMAANAQTLRIEPADTAFIGSGPISFSKGVISADCTIAVIGRVAPDGSHASVDDVTMSGGFRCNRVTANHLPWILTPTSENSGTMSGIDVTVRALLLGGDCGPATVTGNWDNTDSSLQAQNAELSGGCQIEQVAIRFDPAFRVESQPLP